MLKRVVSYFLACLALAGAGCAKSPPTRQEIRKESTQDLKETVEETVTEPQRRRELLALAGELSREATALSDLRDEYHAKVREGNADYDADPAALRETLAEFEAAVIPHRTHMLEALMAMRERATPQEWEEISKQLAENLKENVPGT